MRGEISGLSPRLISPHRHPRAMRTHYTAEINPSLDGETVRVCGWVHDIRNLGGIAFLLLRDREGIVQITLIKKEIGKEMFKEITSLPRESVICVEGRVQRSEQARMGVEILPASVKVLNRAKTPLPLGVADRVGAELDTRLDNRFIDLRKPEVLAVFRIRHSLLAGIRDALMREGFIEVHTPKIIATATEGGTNLFPVRYFERDAYLSQSPQLYKQILMAAGFDRVFEVAPAFRAEEHDTSRHLNEFISIDVEMSFTDEEGAMGVLERALVSGIERVLEERERELETLGVQPHLPELPFTRITYDECVDIASRKGVEVEWGEDLSAEALKAVGEEIPTYYFITRWPMECKPFYVLPFEDDPRYGRAFDLMFGDREITSGAQRNHIPDLLRETMVKKGLNPKNFEFYLRAFEYGMPPHAGWAIGLERITMIVAGLKNIREATLFPRDRNRLVP